MVRTVRIVRSIRTIRKAREGFCEVLCGVFCRYALIIIFISTMSASHIIPSLYAISALKMCANGGATLR